MCVCGCSLETTQTLGLPTDSAVVEAQRQIFDVINEGHTSFGVFGSDGPSVRKVLAAGRSLANRVLNYASTHGLAAVESAGIFIMSARGGCRPQAVAGEKRIEREGAVGRS
jgi:hypothetical protein